MWLHHLLKPRCALPPPPQPFTAGALAAEAAAAAGAVVASPEAQAAFEKAQEVTGFKWIAYLIVWAAWFAWDVSKQNSAKEAEAAAAKQQDAAAAAGADGSAREER